MWSYVNMWIYVNICEYMWIYDRICLCLIIWVSPSLGRQHAISEETRGAMAGGISRGNKPINFYGLDMSKPSRPGELVGLWGFIATYCHMTVADNVHRDSYEQNTPIFVANERKKGGESPLAGSPNSHTLAAFPLFLMATPCLSLLCIMRYAPIFFWLFFAGGIPMLAPNGSLRSKWLKTSMISWSWPLDRWVSGPIISLVIFHRKLLDFPNQTIRG